VADRLTDRKRARMNGPQRDARRPVARPDAGAEASARRHAIDAIARSVSRPMRLDHEPPPAGPRTVRWRLPELG